jgi:Tfp pilus assembly protein PilO
MVLAFLLMLCKVAFVVTGLGAAVCYGMRIGDRLPLPRRSVVGRCKACQDKAASLKTLAQMHVDLKRKYEAVLPQLPTFKKRIVGSSKSKKQARTKHGHFA